MKLNRVLLVCVLCAWNGFIGAGMAQTIIEVPPAIIPPAGFPYDVSSDTTLNIRQGADISRAIRGLNGATVNMFGGKTRGLLGENGSELNLLGGVINGPLSVSDGSTLIVHDVSLGGISADFNLYVGSHTTLSGGRFAEPLFKQLTAELVIEGVDFAFDGASIPGLQQPGDEVSLEVPEKTLFTGVFASGAPFTFFHDKSSEDNFYGNVTLRQVARPSGPSIVRVPFDPAPPGVLPGQTVILEEGGELPLGTNAAPGSTLDIRGGQALEIEAFQATINMSGGLASMTAFTGAYVQISGGVNSRVRAREGSTVQIAGGEVGSLNVDAQSRVRIQDGIVERLFIGRNAETTILGGEVTELVDFSSNSVLKLLGGTILRPVSLAVSERIIIAGGKVGEGEFAEISASNGSEITLVGKHFLLDGGTIDGLVSAGDSVILANRNGEILEAIMKDDSQFKLLISNQPTSIRPSPPFNLISSGATLRLVLVPEALTITQISIALMLLTTIRKPGWHR